MNKRISLAVLAAALITPNVVMAAQKNPLAIEAKATTMSNASVTKTAMNDSSKSSLMAQGGMDVSSARLNNGKLVPPRPNGSEPGVGDLDRLPNSSKDRAGYVSEDDPWDVVNWDPNKQYPGCPKGEYTVYFFLDPMDIECFTTNNTCGTLSWTVMANPNPPSPLLDGRSIPCYKVNNYTVGIHVPPIGLSRLNFRIKCNDGEGEEMMPASTGEPPRKKKCWVKIQPSRATVCGKNNGYRFDFAPDGNIKAVPDFSECKEDD